MADHTPSSSSVAQQTNSLWSASSGDEPSFPPPLPLTAPTVSALFLEQAGSRGNNRFARFRDISDSQWLVYSWREAAEHVEAVASFLLNAGVKPGDRVGIFAGTRYEWLIADIAILAAGAVSVPIYHSLTPSEAAFIVWDSDIEVLFVENQGQYEKIAPNLNRPVTMPETEEFSGGDVTLPLRKLLSFEKVDAGDVTPWSEIIKTPHAPLPHRGREDFASIVYTSGTTGVPKGVLQTHANHLEMLDSVIRSGLMGSGEGVFLFLPLAHSFARLIGYAAIAAGGDLIFPTVIDKRVTKFDAQQIIRDVAASNPVIFPSVPRIYEKVMEALAPETPRTLKERLVAWARRTQDREGVSGMIATDLIRRIRQKVFGKKLSHCVSGGAPLSVEVIQFFDSIGVKIYEGYGLTETTPAITANTPKFRRVGSVGRPFDCNEVVIAESDGEILCRGKNVAVGYWKRPKATAEAWINGWFHTGDVGEIDSDGFLKITDRKKDLIVTAGGKKIPPTFVEGKLKLSTYISQALLFGDRKSYLVALITLNEGAIRGWASERGIELGIAAEHPEVFRLIESEVKKVNAELSSYEQIKKFALLPEDFSIENALLSPTLKLKRREITTRYASLIESLYV